MVGGFGSSTSKPLCPMHWPSPSPSQRPEWPPAAPQVEPEMEFIHCMRHNTPAHTHTPTLTSDAQKWLSASYPSSPGCGGSGIYPAYLTTSFSSSTTNSGCGKPGRHTHQRVPGFAAAEQVALHSICTYVQSTKNNLQAASGLAARIANPCKRPSFRTRKTHELHTPAYGIYSGSLSSSLKVSNTICNSYGEGERTCQSSTSKIIFKIHRFSNLRIQ